MHARDDLSHEVSPFVNRVGLGYERFQEVQKQQRSLNKKKMLGNLLQRLEQMQALEYPADTLQASYGKTFKSLDKSGIPPALPMQLAKNASIKVSLVKPIDDPDFRDIHLNGKLIQTYKDLINHIKLLPFEDAVERMYDFNENGKSDDFVPERPDETYKSLIVEKKPKVEYYKIGRAHV